MKRKFKHKSVNVKYFIIPFFVVAILYSYLVYGKLVGLTDRKYDYMRQETVSVARVYAQYLNKAMHANDVIYAQVDERLQLAAQSMGARQEALGSSLLRFLSESLRVDVIYRYDAQGVLREDSSGKYEGLVLTPEDPAWNFNISGEKTRIDQPRPGIEGTGVYKFIYVRLRNEDFYQIGINVDNISSLVMDFGLSQLLLDIESNEAIRYAHFIGVDATIEDSTQEKAKGTQVEEPKILEAMARHEEYVMPDPEEKDLYQVYVPVILNGANVGTLSLGYSTKGYVDTTLSVVSYGFWILLSVLVLMGGAVFIIYRKTEKHLRLGYYDTLTNLPNEVYMKEFLAGKLGQKKAGNRAIFLINLRNFRTINIALGFEVGDQIIKDVSQRLEEALKQKGMLFRFNADRFVFYVEGYEENTQLEDLSGLITEAFAKPFQYVRSSKQIRPEVGIVEIDERYKNVDDLMKDASITISYLNKGIMDHMVFNAEMRNKIEREEVIEFELIRSYKDIKEEIIHLEYQPKVDAKTSRIVGFEALARMSSKKLGIVSPTEFIDIAEKKQLILPLGTMILEKACIFTRRLVDMGYKDLRMAVNVSGIQLLMDDFTDTVADIISRTGINTRNLELEITETVLLENYDMINAVLQKLRNMGIEISMDDFGTGFSSLASIGELNIDIVKIDRHFIQKIVHGGERNLITTDIISMAHKLGLTVIAEGVENKIQKEYLQRNGCDALQGYYFSRPVSEAKVMELLKEGI